MAHTRWCPLPFLSVVAVTGRDARSFLQGQLTNDLTGLERHPGLLAAACNRQGRVLAVMRLARDRDGVLVVLRREVAATLIAKLTPFVLRADVRFEDRTATLSLAGVLDAPPDPHWTQAGAEAAGLSMLVASPRRLLLAGTRAALDRALAAVPSAAPAEWERASIGDGEPVVHPQTAGLWLPQMLNLDLTAGVSFSKGCYVGQEVIARTHHLGAVKRRMLRYVGPPGIALRPAQALFSGETLAAQVVTSAADADATHALAVVELARCTDLLGATPGGSELVPADLPYAIPAPSDPS